YERLIVRLVPRVDKSGFAEEFYELEPEKDDLIITKNTYDAFTNRNLDTYLKKNNIQYVIAAGVFADGCVHASIQGGFSKGYNFFILKDLIETTDLKIRQELKEKLIRFTWPVMFGRTIESDELFEYVKQDE
ncbi:MAG: isochorismatase family protein, partial [Nanoarchaeota archaeon]|nr:isochorismatase family protein [Nanoarchaeota archaeon]